MTATDIALPSLARDAEFIGQATAVEQARAVAEVQAAVIVAQRIPRDMDRAEAEMRDVCGRIGLANRAFYSVPNRGNGPSVHLARELARLWGNVQYGVHELRRDDERGESEIQAFAWDVQTNTRSTRTFVVPHARMKKVNGKQTREKLIDLGDIYLSNQNIGARAVRECVFTVIPTWFTDEAQDLCRATLEKGEGVPLPQRIENMIGHFRSIDVTLDQLEGKIGRKRGQWTAGDVAQMAITYTSITRDGLDKNEEFPPRRVTADEITGQRLQQPEPTEPAEKLLDTAPAAGARGITPGQSTKLHATLGDLDAGDRGYKLKILSALLQRPVTSSSDLSQDEAKMVIDTLESIAQRDDPKANLKFILEAADTRDSEPAAAEGEQQEGLFGGDAR